MSRFSWHLPDTARDHTLPRLPAAVALAVLLCLASAWLTIASLEGGPPFDTISEAASKAQILVDRLLATLTEAESGQRGYLLTHNPDYLDAYNAAHPRLADDLARLEGAALDDPQRQRGVERIRELAAQRISEMAAAVALLESGEAGPAIDLVRANAGQRRMAAIRAEARALHDDAVVRLSRARARLWPRWSAAVAPGALAAVLLVWVARTQRRAVRGMRPDISHLDRFARAFGLTQGVFRHLDGRIIFWSHGAERLYGYSRAESVGTRSHDLLHTGFPKPLAEIEAILMQTGFWAGELTHRRKDGMLVHVACQWALHRGEPGEADAVIDISNDVTDIRQAEQELRESEVKLQLVLDATDQGVWRWEVGLDTFDLQWDARCKSLFGFHPEDRVNYLNWATAIHTEDREMAEAAMSRALDPANPHDEFMCGFRVVLPDRRVRWLASKGTAVFGPDPNAPSQRRILRILGTMHDVSDARHAERERQRAASLLRTIMESAAGLIYAKDRQGRMLAANAAVMTLIGKSWDQVEGRTDLEYMSDPRQAEAIMFNDREIMLHGRTERVEEALSGEDGQTRVWVSTKAPMRDASGRVIGLVGVSVEITERKQDEDRMRLMINELNHRVKNTLATVQAIAAHSLTSIDSTIRGTLEGRLLAVAAAHDVLTREKWEGATLDDVVNGALLPFGGRNCGRFQVSGPALLLCPRAALALAMGLHELATNALKYGALSVATGLVEISWEVTAGTEAALHLNWIEHDGPPILPPSLRGFGTRLLERGVAHDLNGTASFVFEASAGVTCRIRAPLADVIHIRGTMAFPSCGAC